MTAYPSDPPARAVLPIASITMLSRSIAPAPADLIFTGTSSGTGRTRPGDRLRGGVDGVAEIAFDIAPARSGLRAVA